MDYDEFRKQGENILDYIVHYFESISRRNVTASVCPGYLKPLLPKNAPKDSEPFEEIMKDVEKYIMPGLLHWRHPGFHGYFPGITSYPSLLGTLFCDIFGCTGFNYNMCTVSQDLEAIVLDWYGKMINLPACFSRYSEEKSKGGALLQGNISECVLMSMITARQNCLEKVDSSRYSLSIPMTLASLVAYSSRSCQPYVQKSAVLALVNLKLLDTDENHRLRGETLVKAVKEDKEMGLIPFFVSITIGTLTGASDPVEEIGPICEEYGMWLNIDASYAGNALICPEYQHFFQNSEYASSIAINPAQWLPIHFDCSVVFAKDIERISEFLVIDRTMFGFGPTEEDWSCASYKYTRTIKFYVMLCMYGVEGLQKHVRNHIRMAKLFEKYVRGDERFEVLTSNFAIVCFRLKGPDEINARLLRAINRSGKLLLNSHIIKDILAIRFIVCAEHANEDDMINAWTIIQEFTNKLSETDEEEEDLKEWAEIYNFKLP